MIAGIILGVLAVALLVIGFLGWKRRLPGNKYLGMRIPEVRKNKDVWDAAHQVAGPVWMVAAASLGVGSLLSFAAHNVPWLWLLVVLAVIGALVLISIGANFGAQTAHVLDKHNADQEAAASGCCSAGGQESSTDSDLTGVAMPEEGSVCGSDGGCGTCTHECASKLTSAGNGTEAGFSTNSNPTDSRSTEAAPEAKVDLDAVRRAASAKDV